MGAIATCHPRYRYGCELVSILFIPSASDQGPCRGMDAIARSASMPAIWTSTSFNPLYRGMGAIAGNLRRRRERQVRCFNPLHRGMGAIARRHEGADLPGLRVSILFIPSTCTQGRCRGMGAIASRVDGTQVGNLQVSILFILSTYTQGPCRGMGAIAIINGQ